MNYEKKYKEALEKATRFCALPTDKATMEEIFPELRESEDERIIEEIKFAVMQMPSERKDTKNRCLAWLEKQKEQKPAEWSEEDEDMLNSCISSIEEAKENRYAYRETDGDTSYDHEFSWLKSLRPSWKPSEEQMKALQCAIAFIEIRKSSDYDISPLKSFYEQLKKL